MKLRKKIVIYQVLPRLFGNMNTTQQRSGNLDDNGVGKLSAFTPKVLKQIKDTGTTHIWYTGIIEHATKTDYSAFGVRHDHRAVVKGKAGSPYAIKDYYDVDPDLADRVPDRIKEFEALVKRTHAAGMKVIIDFVPNHVARQYFSDARDPFVEDLGQHDDVTKAFDANNNFYYLPGQTLQLHFGAKQEDFEYSEFPAKVTGNNHFDATPSKNDWYETVKLNYGVDYFNYGACHFDPIPSTWLKMRDILLYWVAKGVDAFRCDMAEMVPVEFWNWVIPAVKQAGDITFIAEVYNPDQYRNYIFTGHFDYLYDKVGLYDTLREVMCNRQPASAITQCWYSLDGIHDRMLNFLENHDEQRIASDFFCGRPEPGIPAMAVSALMHTNPVMLYFGQEYGERGMDEEGFSGLDGRTTIFDYWSIQTMRAWNNGGKWDGAGLTDEQKQLRTQYANILRIAATEPVIANGTFYDLMHVNTRNPELDSNRQYVFLRKYLNEVILVAVNFDASDRKVRIRIPAEVFNEMDFTDNKPAKVTDLLSGVLTLGTLTESWPYELLLPAFGVTILKFTYL